MAKKTKGSSKDKPKSSRMRIQEAMAGSHTATADPIPDLLAGDEETTVVISEPEAADLGVARTPEFGSAIIIESQTVESPIAVAETTDGEPKIKSAAQKKWREKNREKVQTYQKKWREKNPEKVKQIHTDYRKKNPEKVKEWQKASQARRKDKAAAEKPAEPVQS